MTDVEMVGLVARRMLAPVSRPWLTRILPHRICAVTETRGALLGCGYHRTLLTLSDGNRYGGHPVDQHGYRVYPPGWEPPAWDFGPLPTREHEAGEETKTPTG